MLLPDEIREARQWVARTRTKRPFAVGDKRPRKGVKWNDPSKFVTYDEAEAGIKGNRVAAGVGFYLTDGDPWAVIDLDVAFDATSKELHPWAAEIIELFKGAPMERSQSGCGVHIFIRTSRVFGTFSHKFSGVAEGELAVDKMEGYEAYACRRYIAMTGDWLETMDPKERIPVMDAQLVKFFALHERYTGEAVSEDALAAEGGPEKIEHKTEDPDYIEGLVAAAMRGSSDEELPYAAHRGWMKMRDAVWNTVGYEAGLKIIRKWLPRNREGENTENKLSREAYEARTAAPGEAYLRKQAEKNIEKLEDEGEITPDEAQASIPDRPIEEGVLDDIYYNDRSKDYLLKDHFGNYISISKADALLELEMRGISRKVGKKSKGISHADRVLQDIRATKNVIAVQTVGGIDAGPFKTISGGRVLVPSSPERVVPAPGDWSIIQEHLWRMLGADGADENGVRQYETFQAWMRCAWLQFKKGVDRGLVEHRGFDPGQAVYFCGPIRSGKSLTQSLITWALGGRSSNVASWLKGDERFTFHMFGTEHLMVADDTSTSWSENERQRYADKIKEVAANRDHQCNPKFGKPFQATPFWRLTISLNDNPEHIARIPSFYDPTIADKLIVFKCYNYEESLAPEELRLRSNRDRFGEKLESQIPAWLHYLENWTPPARVTENMRYGVKAFHNPTIVEECQDISEEIELYKLICGAVFDKTENPDKKPVAFRCSELVMEVSDMMISDSRRRRLRELAPSAKALTMKLRRVQRAAPHVVSYNKNYRFEGSESYARAWVFEHPENRTASPIDFMD